MIEKRDTHGGISHDSRYLYVFASRFCLPWRALNPSGLEGQSWWSKRPWVSRINQLALVLCDGTRYVSRLLSVTLRDGTLPLFDDLLTFSCCLQTWQATRS